MSSEKSAKKRADRSGSRSFPLVMTVFVVLLAAGVALGVAIHGRYVAFERTVARHVPGDAAFVVRWDVEKVTLFEPTRRYLLPLLDAAPHATPRSPQGGTERPPKSGTRRERLAEASGLDVGRDLREAMAVVGPGERDWSLVLGGSFPKSGVVSALERVLAEEGRSVRRLGEERFEASGGISFGRASDGVLVLASSPERLEASLAVRAFDPAVPRTGAGSLLLRADAPGLSSDVRALLAELGDVSRVEAVASWGSPLQVEVTVHHRGAPPSDALARARRVVAELMGPGTAPPTELVSQASTPNGRTTLRIRLNDEALERAARRAGDSVYGTLAGEGRKSAVP
jgi:hypothetical protein